MNERGIMSRDAYKKVASCVFRQKVKKLSVSSDFMTALDLQIQPEDDNRQLTLLTCYFRKSRPKLELVRGDAGRDDKDAGIYISTCIHET